MSEKFKASIGSLLEKYSRYIVFFLIISLPLIFWIDFQTVFTVPKLLLFRTASVLLFIILLLKTFLSDKIEIRSGKFSLSLIFVALAALLSSFFSLNQFTSLFGQYGRFMGLITTLNFILFALIVSNLFQKKEHLLSALTLSVIASFLISLYGLLQHFNLFQLNITWSDSPESRVFSTIGHANHLGAYLAGQIFVAIALLKIALQKGKKLRATKVIFFAAVALLNLVVLILTASRGALVSLILVAILITFLSAKTHKAHKNRKKPLMILGLCIVILTVFSIAFWPSIKQISMVERTQQTISQLESGATPERISFIKSAWQIFLSHPLSGSGLDTFRDGYSKNRLPDYIIQGEGNAQNITVPESSHNLIADLLSMQGILGFLAYLFLFVVIWMSAKKIIRNSNDLTEKALVTALLSVFLIFIIQTLFSFGDITNIFWFWLSAALIISQTPLQNFEISFKKLPKYFLTLLILILLGLFSWDHIINLGNADIALKKAKKAEANYQLLTAENDYFKAIQEYSSEYSFYQSLADLSLKIAVLSTDQQIKETYLNRAILNYNNAIQLNNNYSSTHNNLALAHLYFYRLTKDMSHYSLSNENFQLAIAKSPTNPRYYYEYARKLHSDFNDKEKAVEYLKMALKINPNYQEPKDYLNFLFANHPELEKE